MIVGDKFGERVSNAMSSAIDISRDVGFVDGCSKSVNPNDLGGWDVSSYKIDAAGDLVFEHAYPVDATTGLDPYWRIIINDGEIVIRRDHSPCDRDREFIHSVKITDVSPHDASGIYDEMVENILDYIEKAIEINKDRLSILAQKKRNIRAITMRDKANELRDKLNKSLEEMK